MNAVELRKERLFLLLLLDGLLGLLNLQINLLLDLLGVLNGG